MALEVGAAVTLGVVGGDFEGTAEGLLTFCYELQVLVTCVQVSKVHELYTLMNFESAHLLMHSSVCVMP